MTLDAFVKVIETETVRQHTVWQLRGGLLLTKPPLSTPLHPLAFVYKAKYGTKPSVSMKYNGNMLGLSVANLEIIAEACEGGFRCTNSAACQALRVRLLAACNIIVPKP